MVDNDPNVKPGKGSNPTRVREPDNSRPPSEPTPRKPMEPQDASAEERSDVS
ncbi:MAG: hypothetical protein QOE90_2382 [Thermoplasmata archaeon]|jgi:hypothetical protein|nr:hypothetical protein [Thermoplasmata archaeon]